MVLDQHQVASSKTLYEVPGVWGMLLGHGLHFVQEHHTCNSVKEQGLMQKQQTGAQYSVVEYIRDRAAVCNVLAPAAYPEPSHLGGLLSPYIIYL